jgi:hypothetical protein
VAEEKIPDQIPWAEHVKVTHQSDLSIDLEHRWENAERNRNKTTADIFHRDFEWSISIDSMAAIKSHMTLDTRMTKDIQEFWEADKEKHYGSTYKDRIMRWLKGGIARSVRSGPKEWRPERKHHGITAKLTDTYGYANTYNEDSAYWWGDTFEFAHFETEDGDEGAVILWNRGGGPMGSYFQPEVWMGDFEEFMSFQNEGDPWSVETFLGWNSTFENGFMWAWEKMGVFDDPDEHIEDLKDRHVKQVLDAIEKEPSILLPESVEKILLQFDEFPRQIQKAVTWLMNNHKRDLEKALGQKLIWGDLYGE